MDSFLKSTKTLRLYRSNFRQIFPKEMTNETRNIIETIYLEDVSFLVKNTLFKNDNIKSIALA